MASNGFTNGTVALDLALLNNRLSTLFGESGHDARRGSWVPAVDLQETAEGLVVTLEVPGMTRDEIEIQMENDTLVVLGTKPTTPRGTGRFHVNERTYGAFRRAFRVPRWVETAQISAELENGVLSIRLPKVAAAQPRRIEIGGRQSA